MYDHPVLAEYASFFAEVSEPTMKSSADLWALQEARRKYNNPESFHLTVNPRAPVEITWSYNTKFHLGHNGIDREIYLGMFHPRWLFIFIASSLSVLKIHRRVSEEQYKPDQSINLMVPLRQVDGSYYWYNMYAIPGAYDKRGMLTRHIDVFQRICPFDDFFPVGPRVSINGESKSAHIAEVKQAIERVMSRELKQMLTPSSYKNLQAYRINGEFVAEKWHSLSHEKMGGVLGKSRQALDRANVRLLQSARQMFPAAALSSVPALAMALNGFCGKPSGLCS